MRVQQSCFINFTGNLGLASFVTNTIVGGYFAIYGLSVQKPAFERVKMPFHSYNYNIFFKYWPV